MDIVIILLAAAVIFNLIWTQKLSINSEYHEAKIREITKKRKKK